MDASTAGQRVGPLKVLRCSAWNTAASLGMPRPRTSSDRVQPATYKFDEDELNSLGYQLMQTKRFKEAIRIFQLNVEAYPRSSNVYDSLGEAYMDDGNKPQAIANYQKSLQLNPKNRNALVMLQKLNAP